MKDILLLALCAFVAVAVVNADENVLHRNTREVHKYKLPPSVYGPDAYRLGDHAWNMQNNRPLVLVDKIILGSVCGLLGVGAIGAGALYFYQKSKKPISPSRA